MLPRRPSGLLFILILLPIILNTADASGKEFLTRKEIENIQDTHEIAARVKIYTEAALLRLRSAENRLVGKETVPGDPLEFFTPEDMLDGYYRILKSIMMNLDDAVQNPGTDRGAMGKALKNLKSSTEKAAEHLQILKKIAEDKKKEEFWNLANKAIEITNGAHDGAEYGLSKYPAPPEKKKKQESEVRSQKSGVRSQEAQVLGTGSK
jgi:hypothetical protein